MAPESSTNPAWRLPPPSYHLLEALGLRLIAHIPVLRDYFQLNDEIPKQIMRTSIPVAIARITIHIVPILVSTVLIAMNLKGFYLGRTLPGVLISNDITAAMLQVLAKIQELLIVSSLSTIIFSAIRVQLLYGAGVPLGLLSSGFNFSQITYFWSEEYWGSMKAPIPRRMLFPFAFLLLTAGLIAVTAGPASAVLMVPRQQDYYAGVTSFYMRGLADDLQPNRVVGLESTMDELCLNSSATSLSTCPNGGFHSLMAYAMKQQDIKNGDNLRPPTLGITGQFAGQVVPIDSMTAHVSSSLLIGDIRGLACQTSVLAPWIPVAMYQEALYDDWYKAINTIVMDLKTLSQVGVAEYKYNFKVYLSTRTVLPIVRTACSPAQNASSEEMTVNFPILPEDSCWNDIVSANFPQFQSTPSSRLKVTWVPLPSTFGAASAGMIFESPWFHNGDSRIVVGCSIDARWADGRVTERDIGFSLNNLNQSESWGLAQMGLFSNFRPLNDGSWTQITLDESWLAALTPLNEPPSPSASNMTTFEMILQSSALIDENLLNASDPTIFWNEIFPGASNRTLFLEWITALLVSDGLSRYGSDRVLNSSGPPSEWSLMDYNKRPDSYSRFLGGTDALEPPQGFDYTTFEAEIHLEGLTYQAQSITDYLSIAVLLVHIILALGHIIYVFQAHQSSGSWGTITELLILAYGSRPVSSALRNVSAGIKCIKTYRKVAIVRAANLVRSTRDKLDGDHKHAELVLLADDGVKANPVDSSVERNNRRNTWPLMSSQLTSSIELSKYSRPTSSTTALLTPRNPRSRSEDSDTRRLFGGFDKQQRTELDEFYS
ncbi:hypothetical protein Hte_007091 [Hypoxylon texense]